MMRDAKDGRGMTGKARHASPDAVLRVVIGAVAVLAVVTALVENSLYWYWQNTSGAGGPNAQLGRSFDAPFRMLMRLALLGSFLGAFALGRFRLVKQVLANLAPLLAFFLFGVVALTWSIAKVESAKYLVAWALSYGGLAAASAYLPAHRLRRVLGGVFTFCVLTSFLAYFLMPDIATGYHFGNPVVRGLFVHKNSFGYFSCLGVVTLMALGHHKTLVGLAMLALLWAGVVASGSATALALAVIGSGFVLLLRGVVPHRHMHLPVVVIFVSAMVVSGLVLIFARDLLTDLMGRDVTLSGRTNLWAGYLATFGDKIVLGQGAGLFSTFSERGALITRALPGFSNDNLGHPHNLFIGILGEVGIVGLILFLGGHFWILLVSPFRNNSEWAVLAAGLSLVILLRALAEDNDGYQVSVAFILVTLARGQIARGDGKRGDGKLYQKTRKSRGLAKRASGAALQT